MIAITIKAGTIHPLYFPSAILAALEEVQGWANEGRISGAGRSHIEC